MAKGRELYWTQELIAEEAKKYQHRFDFKKGSCGAYEAWRRIGMPQEMVSHMTKKPHKWNLKTLTETASKYFTRTEWYLAEGSAYKSWVDLGRPQSVVSHMEYNPDNPKEYWTMDRIISVAKQYTSTKDWHKNCRASFNYWMRKYNADPAATAHMK